MQRGSTAPHAMHGTILAIDVEAFNAQGRSDVDRVDIRRALQSILKTFIDTHFSDRTHDCLFMELGDGIGVVFPADLEKAFLLIKLLDYLPSAIIQHNHGASAHRSFRARAVLHYGEFFIDDAEATGHTAVGAQVNHVFRLLDSDTARTALRAQPSDAPLLLAISADFHYHIVMQQIPWIQNRFREVQVQAKDEVNSAWLYLPNRQREKDSETESPSGSSTPPPRRTALKHDTTASLKGNYSLADLPGSYIYLATADRYNYDLYRAAKGSVPLHNHLETALLLGTGALLHCVDPYRSNSVSEVLETYKDFITRGQIMFLLGRDIQSVRRDFRKYLHRKAGQYQQSDHGATDVGLLKHSNDDDALEQTISFIESSPVMLYRHFPGTRMFVESVKADFTPCELLASSDPYANTNLRHVNLTLRQLLLLRRIVRNNSLSPVLATDRVTDELSQKVPELARRETFSRRILYSTTKEFIQGENRAPPEPYLRRIEIRINLLHLRINTGRHTFTELDPERDEDSPYFYEHLLRHLSLLAGVAPRDHLGPELTKILKNQAVWTAFASHHLRVLADLQVRRMADMPVEASQYYFERSRQVPEFATLASIIREHWS